jgi:transcriptional regulator with XRE-family HTH domain
MGRNDAGGANLDIPHPVDLHVGARMRIARTNQGLSQVDLAQKVGVSFQAIQKYEAGEIRISASRLYDVARSLGVSPGSFFTDYPGAGAAEALDIQDTGGAGSIDRREVMTLVRGYLGIRDKAVQRDILRLVTHLGQADEAADGVAEH